MDNRKFKLGDKCHYKHNNRKCIVINDFPESGLLGVYVFDNMQAAGGYITSDPKSNFKLGWAYPEPFCDKFRHPLIIGDNVTFIPGGQKGRVKSFSKAGENAYVVFWCDDDWSNYLDYTGEYVKLTDIQFGWREGYNEELQMEIMKILEDYVDVDRRLFEEITDRILETVPKDRLANVEKFMITSGANIEPNFDIETIKESSMELYLELILEELVEFAEAYSNNTHKYLCELFSHYADRKYLSPANLKTGSAELIDALIDLEYVLHNAVIGLGLSPYWNRLHNAVHEANMSKFDLTEEDAKITVKMYLNGTHPLKPNERIITNYKKVGNYYVVYRESTHKIMKSHKHVELDLSLLSEIVDQ